MNPRIQAQALAQQLIGRGFGVRLYKSGPHWQHPCIRISNGVGRSVRWVEFVYAAPEGDEWFFYWSSLERIERISEVAATADKINFVLGLPK
jgi:hypothetical protein